MNAIQNISPEPAQAAHASTPFRKESLSNLLDDIKIHGPHQFQIGERPVVSVDTSSITATPPSMTQRLSSALWPELYTHAYAVPYGKPTTPTSCALSVAEFVSQLREAFPEGVRWSADWEVYKTDANGAIHVRKGDCCRHMQPGTFALSMPGPVQEKSVVSILLPLASSQLQPAFYHISGQTPHSDHDDAALARLYFNTKAATVTRLMLRIIDALNGYAVPFRAKTLTDPAGYDRTDSTVFYFARRHLPFALALIRDLLGEELADLDADVPLFSRRLADGIGGADDPGYGMSFGQTRAMLMADAIVESWTMGQQTARHRLDRMEQRFAASGLSLATPHLSAGNIDIYTFPA